MVREETLKHHDCQNPAHLLCEGEASGESLLQP